MVSLKKARTMNGDVQRAVAVVPGDDDSHEEIVKTSPICRVR
jgi:hypothetical protein